MKTTFNFLYKNGVSENIILEVTKEELENAIKVIKTSFKGNINAVLSFNDGKSLNIVNLNDASRINIKGYEKLLNK